VLRGAFGAALRAVSCPAEDTRCDDCATREGCAYLYLFETPLPSNATQLRAADHVPHPFVLRPWSSDRKAVAVGEDRELELVLVGRACDLFPHVLVAVGRMASGGLGSQRVPFRLVGIEQLDQHDDRARRPIFDEQRQIDEIVQETVRSTAVDDTLELELLTPAQIVSDGQVLDHFELRPFVRALLRRMSSLSAFHCGASLDVDYRGLIDRAGTVRVSKAELRSDSFDRYSARQKRRVPHRGLLGRVTLEGKHLDELAPLLALGEVLHVGKGTAMGMGRYRLDTGCQI
jgi:hypothetical protein